METVKVSVKGAGSLEVEGVDAKEILSAIEIDLGDRSITCRKIKRGPKKKVVEQ